MTVREKGSGMYCFTLDDNIRFLEEATTKGLGSVFEHPYLDFLGQMHQKYGTKFQMNMYYSYEPGGFSLADVPGCWRKELEGERDWLRFSFHALHNDPAFPYEFAGPEKLLDDYRKVMEQMHRIAGDAATDVTTTLHYVCAPKDTCAALRSVGIKGLIGMFRPIDNHRSLRYYLTLEQAAVLQKEALWYDAETNLYFACNDMVLNAVERKDIVPLLKQRPAQDFFHVMIHEQYFYPDSERYQPDFKQKVEEPLGLFRNMGLKSCFFEELL